MSGNVREIKERNEGYVRKPNLMNIVEWRLAPGNELLAAGSWLLAGDCIMEFLFSNEKKTQKGRDHWAS